MSGDDVVELTVDGTTYAIALPEADSDYIQQHIASTREPYEFAMLQDLASRLAPGDVVVDVGANVGNHTIFLAMVAGCRVEAFEPDAELAAAIERSAAVNDANDRVRVHATALGRQTATGHLVNADPSNRGGQHLELGTGDVPVVALDDVEIRRPVRAIKIDVEGMEPDVLRGAEHLIAEDRPLVYVECADEAAFGEVATWLDDRGYVYWETFNATPTQLFRPAEEVDRDQAARRLLLREARNAYRSIATITTLRSKLDAANLKYRKAGENHQALRANYETLQARAAEERSRLRARLDKADLALAEARDALARSEVARAELAGAFEALRGEVDRWSARAEELSSALDSARHSAADLTREVGIGLRREENLRAEIASLVAARDAVKSELDATRVEAAEASHRAQVAERRLREVRASITYRTGKAVREALGSPRALMRLPVTLWRLRREQRTSAPERATEAPRAAVSTPRTPEPVPPVLAAIGRSSVAPERRRTRPRIAAIVDEFTGLSLAPDCDLVHLTPDSWRDALEAGRPDLLFVESAWRGFEGTWHNTVPRLPDELRQIIRWCRDRGVPTAFWNKEDPVHYTTFLTTAREFDHVFTTDLDCVPRYKAALGHDRVYLLPFAAQPKYYNPIEDGRRKDAFCFAGAYYRRYPERTRDLDAFLEHLPSFRPIEIYDRNYGGSDENYMFPEKYRSFIVGTLPPERVAEAYKSYKYGLNLNSVKQSQSMFARRVFELLASNTIAVSNFSRGVRVMFGDLTVCTDSGPEAVRRLKELEADPDRLARVRLAALRSVMSQHTYADRIGYVLAKVTGAAAVDPLPGILVIGRAADVAGAERIQAAVARQEGVTCRLLLVANDGLDGLPEGIRTIAASAAADVRVSDLAHAGELVALLHPDDYYGPRYLFDLALATRYTDAQVIGKRTRYQKIDDAVRLVDVDSEYRPCGRLPLRSSVATATALGGRSLGSLVDDLDVGLHDAPEQVALDRFSYCQDGATDPVSATVDDLDVWSGVPLADLQAAAERANPAPGPGEGQRAIDVATLAEWFADATRPEVGLRTVPGGWRVESHLADTKHEYVYAPRPVPVARLWPDGTAQVFVDAAPGLDLQFVFIFQDEVGERAGILWAPSHLNAAVPVPAGAVSVRVGLRVRGPGVTTVRSVVLEHVESAPQVVVPTSQDLVLTNHYPSYSDLYRNGFVHARLRAYRRRGERAEVFRLRSEDAFSFGEFESVDVTTGGQSALRNRLQSGVTRSILVHFLEPAMWDVLAEIQEVARIVVWVHGAEVQPWWRRVYNYRDAEELERAKEASALRLEFWRRVFAEAGVNVHFVFVSRYFADEVMEDVGVELEPQRYSIIHNPIDTEIFTYTPKDTEQRKRILSIRPFASAKYANDLTVAAIQELRGEPWFGDLEFRIVGDGDLFEETLAPVRGLRNVRIERRFLSQGEIARLHQEYGVFVVPTRMDAQGVSRDEAMASGLVPVTNAVAAIPEFVDDRCGILAPAEDSGGLADGIRRLYADPQLFADMSRAAAQRVRRQSGESVVVEKELALITGADEGRLK